MRIDSHICIRIVCLCFCPVCEFIIICTFQFFSHCVVCYVLAAGKHFEKEVK